MADEELSINGRLIKELKLSELKEACKQRDISYAGSKAVLQKRLSAVLELENLQKAARNAEGGLVQPNIEIENDSENDFVKLYLENQRKMLQETKNRFSGSESVSEEEDQSNKTKGHIEAVTEKASNADGVQSIDANVNNGNSFAQENEKMAANCQLASGDATDSEGLNAVTENQNNTDAAIAEKQEKSNADDVNGETSGDVEASNEKNIEPEKVIIHSDEQITEPTEPEHCEAVKPDKQVETKECIPDEHTQEINSKTESDDKKSEEEIKASVDEVKENTDMEISAESESNSNPPKTQDSEEMAVKQHPSPQNVEEASQIEENSMPTVEKGENNVDETEKDSPPAEMQSITTNNEPIECSEKSEVDVEPDSHTVEESMESKNHSEETTENNPQQNSSNIVVNDSTLSVDVTNATLETGFIKDSDMSANLDITQSSEDRTEEEGVPVISMGDELTMDVEELDYEEIEQVDDEAPVTDHRKDSKRKKKKKNSSKERERSSSKKDKDAALDPHDTPEKADVVKNDEVQSKSDTTAQEGSNDDPVSVKPSKRKISLKKNPLRRSLTDEQPRERKRKWGKSKISDNSSSSISINTDLLKDIVKVEEDAFKEAVADLPDGEEGEIVEEVVEEEIEEVIVEETMEVQGKAADEDGYNDEEPMETVEGGEEGEIAPKEELAKHDKRKVIKVSQKSKEKEKSGKSKDHQSSTKSSDKAEIKIEPGSDNAHIIHVSNLVRPYALSQLKQLLSDLGPFQSSSFWIDNIKSHCFVSYDDRSVAEATVNALNGKKWPQCSPNSLIVQFSSAEEVAWCKEGKDPSSKPRASRTKKQKRVAEDKAAEKQIKTEAPKSEKAAEARVRERGDAERPSKRESSWRREKEREGRGKNNLREWDLDKVDQDAESRRTNRKSRSPVDRRSPRRRRDEGRERDMEYYNPPPPPQEPPKLLDDLFKKTKALPCIYWLPLTEEEAVKRAEQHKEKQKKREEERRKEEEKREKELEERRKAREEERRREEKRMEEERKSRELARKRRGDASTSRGRDDSFGRMRRRDDRSRDRDPKRHETSSRLNTGKSRSSNDANQKRKQIRPRTKDSSSSSSDSSSDDSSDSDSSSSGSSDSDSDSSSDDSDEPKAKKSR